MHKFFNEQKELNQEEGFKKFQQYFIDKPIQFKLFIQAKHVTAAMFLPRNIVEGRETYWILPELYGEEDHKNKLSVQELLNLYKQECERDPSYKEYTVILNQITKSTKQPVDEQKQPTTTSTPFEPFEIEEPEVKVTKKSPSDGNKKLSIITALENLINNVFSSKNDKETTTAASHQNKL